MKQTYSEKASMTVKEFNEKLKIAGLKKKDFAEKTSLPYGSITNWGQEARPVPKWVESWLDLYIESKTVKKIISQLKESGLCKE